MKFYLGTKTGGWLSYSDIPLFISRRTLVGRKKLPMALSGWALDSGGFTELSLYGKWVITPQQYIEEVRRYSKDIGNLDWAACMDYMCEPFILKQTGLSVEQHQRLTVENYLELRTLNPDLPIIPVLQGWKVDDYMRHVDMYQQAGVELSHLPRVGLGSVCRRQHTPFLSQLVYKLQPIKLHGFGVKKAGIESTVDMLASADSIAWSYRARHSPPLPGCTHQNCANCWKYASQWYTRLTGHVAAQQKFHTRSRSMTPANYALKAGGMQMGGITLSKPDTRPVVLSLGAGVQSTTLYLMACEGKLKPKPAFAIFADTGDEPAHVYEQLDWLEQNYGQLIPIIRVSHGHLSEDIIKSIQHRSTRFSSIPAYIKPGNFNGKGHGGQGIRQCTREYKIDPINRYTWRIYRGEPIVTWIGISLDEAQRMKPSRLRRITHQYPLVEHRMTRADCIDWLTQHGFPVPQRSSCVFCPYHPNQQWASLKAQPAEWQKIVTMDNVLRKWPNMRGEVFLHRSLQPIEQVDFSTAVENEEYSFDAECEGMCGV